MLKKKSFGQSTEGRGTHRKLNLPINPAGSQQCRVKDVNPVGGHDHLDVLSGLLALSAWGGGRVTGL
jgi:hypothetical protein